MDEGFRIGQIWKDKKRSATSTFLILKLKDRQYSDGDTALRVNGVGV